ncbi:MAG: VOC family protein [Promethearchaeota archaeon]|jgi:predicted enzyme related to lactoylglutathione lyase
MTEDSEEKSLFRKIDCIRIPVPSLEKGLNFYKDLLGHQLIWRTESAVGLRIPESEAELVIHTEGDESETDIKVTSAGLAALRFKKVGGSILKGPFDIPIGKCCVVMDPWGNKFVLLDSSKGVFKTDSNGYVIGLQ